MFLGPCPILLAISRIRRDLHGIKQNIMEQSNGRLRKRQVKV